MGSIAHIPRCTGASGPPCHRLLSDPEGVLADRNQWPNHICDAVARHSTTNWARDRVGAPLQMEIAHWIRMWPLPVGALTSPHIEWERSPLLTGRLCRPGIAGGSLAALRFQGKAAIILTPDIPWADVVAFGIIDDHPAVAAASEGAIDMVPVDMQFTQSGWQDDRVAAFRKHASQWWNVHLRGQELTGRREGRAFTRADVIATYRAFHAEHGGRPSQAVIAAVMNVTSKSVRTYVGQRWTAFVREIEAGQTR